MLINFSFYSVNIIVFHLVNTENTHCALIHYFIGEAHESDNVLIPMSTCVYVSVHMFMHVHMWCGADYVYIGIGGEST